MKTPFETHRQEAFVSDMSAWLDLFFEPLIPSTRREEISNTASGHETVSPNDLERFIVAIEKLLSERIPNFLAWRVAIHGNASDFTDLIFFDEGAPLDSEHVGSIVFSSRSQRLLVQ